jgi:hypothetical protein
VRSLGARVFSLAAASDAQAEASARLARAVNEAYDDAAHRVDVASGDGSLLRGEVLARWYDVIGTGDVMRAFESRVAWLRDRVRAAVTGRPAADAELRTAVESSVDGLVHAAADRAAEESAESWRARPAGKALIEPRLDAASAGLLADTREEVRRWQGYVFDLVGEEGLAKRSSARVASLGVNGAGLAVMLAVFLQTGGLTGAEVVVAGGSSALGHKVLEAILGDQAVRSLAARARDDLLERVDRLLAAEAARFRTLVEPVAPAAEQIAAVEAALAAVQGAR